MGITKVTVTLKAQGVANEELAMVHGRLPRWLKYSVIWLLFRFSVVPRVSLLTLRGCILWRASKVKSRRWFWLVWFFDAYGRPLFGATEIEGEPREIDGLFSVNPSKREQPFPEPYCNRYCRYRPYQYTGYRTKNSILCWPRPAF